MHIRTLSERNSVLKIKMNKSQKIVPITIKDVPRFKMNKKNRSVQASTSKQKELAFVLQRWNVQ